MRTAAQHYADALADVAMARNAALEASRELRDFMALLQASPQLKALLSSPAVSRANKHAVAQQITERMGSSQILRNFLFVVIDHRRVALLAEIQEAFETQLDVRRGITRANVTSARALNDDEKARLRRALERLSGQKVEAEYELDPALIAGAVVRVGSTIYDGSVRTQLDKLRARLVSQ